MEESEARRRPATANILASVPQHDQIVGSRAQKHPDWRPLPTRPKLNLVSLFSDYDKQRHARDSPSTPRTARSSRGRRQLYHPLVTHRELVPVPSQTALESQAKAPASKERQASFIRREHVLHRVQVREFRDQLFTDSTKKFTPQDVDNLCKLLLGRHERSDVNRSSLKSPEERSYSDCEALCNVVRSSKHLVEAFDDKMRAILFRCAQVIRLHKEEALSNKFHEEGLVLMIRGKLIERDESDRRRVLSSLTKGDVLVCMPDSPIASLPLKDAFRRSLQMKAAVKGGSEVQETVSQNPPRDDLKRSLARLNSHKLNFTQFSELSGLCFTKNASRFTTVDACDTVVLSSRRVQDFATEFSQDLKESIWVCDLDAWKGQSGDWKRMVLEIRQGRLHLRLPGTSNDERYNLAESEILRGLPVLKYLESEIELDQEATFGLRLLQVHLDNSLTCRRFLFASAAKDEKERIVDVIKYYMSVQGYIKKADLERLETSGGSICKARRQDESEYRNSCFQRLLQAHDSLMSNRVAELASFLCSLKIFCTWAWKDVFAMAQSAKALSVPKGSFVFQQNDHVKGLYFLRLGLVSIVQYKTLKETSLRFPGRDDLFMEEALEFQVRGVQKKILLGRSGDESVFGEELVNGKHSKHSFSLEVDNYAVLICIPWEAILKVLEEKKKLFQAFTETLLKNLSKRSAWIELRMSMVQIDRFHVEIGKFRHLDNAAFEDAAARLQELMNVYHEVIGIPNLKESCHVAVASS
uniref:Cyclic nucleotide-binding domain-containing protein n=1 Tax=Guillardia theta TaxID=55529 RepID=A0A6U5YTY5_GUITH|mmetsp:Transcript_23750/g.77317  ORF Transcript_23750/g.77317 Transcript_23750/m.77317 type:complete len:754 (+) Transcript_23750:324-2585(+)